jgi:putative acetyltransferase
MVEIRSEKPTDYAGVYQVNIQAFGRPNEAELIDNLRPVVQPHISLVAELEGQIVGHIFFSPVSIESPQASQTAMGLGPVAVLPAYQNQGIGTKLVEAGLEACRQQGHKLIVVLGHPNFYPRFGFIPAGSLGLRFHEPVPEQAFMLLELSPGTPIQANAVVRYHPEFDKV